MIRSKLIACTAAAAMLAVPVLSSSADARPRGGWGHHGHGWRHGGVGAGIAGFAAGALIGGALASRPYYRPYAYGPAYYDYGPGYAAAPGGDAVAYCMQRFKSYDPASGTYLGYDGIRHPCP